MAQIVLATLNARYIHASFGLRYLLANMGSLRPATELLEATIKDRPIDVVERIIALEPAIVGLGVYVWNAQQSLDVVRLLKALRPETWIVLGGPEVSYELDQQAIVRAADYVITGEGDVTFPALCRRLLAGEVLEQKVWAGEPADLASLRLPYALYSDEDIAHRVIYVEASRGCPYLCEFCLSALDRRTRAVPLERFFAAMDELLARGARQLKFVDRTFNLSLDTSCAVLEFFLQRYRPGMFLHFEMIPDRLPSRLREVIARFPPGALQFEVGVQTLDAEVAQRISRRQDLERLRDNFAFLRRETGVHVHADLIAGLPGESLESFAAGFDALLALGPDEIQLGILKRLRGTPIARHTEAYGMVYSPAPPYEILQNNLLSFATLQRVKRFARYWDLVVNSGNFVGTGVQLWNGSSSFWRFWELSEWLFEQSGRTHSIALGRLAQLLFEYLVGPLGRPVEATARSLVDDFVRAGNRKVPTFLRQLVAVPDMRVRPAGPAAALPPRQARHLGWQAEGAPKRQE